MAEVIIMPKLGFNMDEGKLVTWYKSEGDEVAKGEPLFAIETDKTNIDIEATGDGIVRKLLIEEGDTVPVTLPIAIVAGADENIDAELADAKAKLGGGDAPAEEPAPAAATAPAAEAAPAATPAPAASDKDAHIVVIGGGPGGYVAALRAAQLGGKVTVIEEIELGGVCLNRGCIPTKAMLKSASVADMVKEAAAFGINVGEGVVDFKQVVARKDAVVKQLTGGVAFLLKAAGIEVVYGKAVFTGQNEVSVTGKDGAVTKVSGDKFIIATGTRPVLPPVPGMELEGVIASEEIFKMKEMPKRMVVHGGGVIAVEFAQMYHSFGAKVDMIVRSRLLRTSADVELSDILTKEMKKKGINIHIGSNIEEVKKGSDGLNVVLKNKDGSNSEIPCDNLLVCLGREPLTKDLGLDIVGVKTDADGYVLVDDRMKTNVDGFYAIGDVNGGVQLAHVASREGEIAAENIMGLDAKADYKVYPNCIFTTPEIASAGLTEEEAVSKGYNIKVGRFPFSANGKALAEGESVGLVKIIADVKTSEIYGIHIIGPQANVLVAEGALAIENELTLEEITQTIHAHPTLSEAVTEAALAADNKALHVPNK
jgi:dihydrolipoamide dehydrogenase